MKIIDLMRKASTPFYSLEFFPPKDRAQWPAFMEVAGKLKALNPLFVSVTYGAGGSSHENTLEIAGSLKEECGYIPMTHLTCVGADADNIRKYLISLRACGIDNILALRGDAPIAKPGTPVFDWAAGKFKFAADLVGFVRREFQDFGIGVAGYPSPHPESPTLEMDRAYTKNKLDAGSDFVVTQLFFDVREYIDLVRSLRLLGVEKPVIPGILPIQSFDSLRHVLALCGANIPAKLYISLEEADKRGGQEAVREAGIRFAAEQIRRLVDAGAPGIHLYTLNKAEICLRLAEAAG